MFFRQGTCYIDVADMLWVRLRAIFKLFKYIMLLTILSVTLPSLAGQVGFSEAFLSHIEQRYGADAKERVEDWQDLIKDEKADPDGEWQLINKVNSFF